MEFSVKSNEKSNSLRADGNEFYKQKNFFDALLKYNESLCYSEDGSESAGHAFANRSAIYLEMKLFDECLRNIEAAFSHKYPEKNHDVLKKREEKCRQMMKNLNKKSSREEEILEFFKLSHEPNDKIKSIAGCLELKCNKKYGRHIITSRGLSVGDIIAIDKPYCTILRKEFLYQRCSNCNKINNLSLLPCDGCCEVMFCSIKCREEANKKFHQHECKVMHLIKELTDNIHMALRTFFKALSSFDSIEAFEKFMNDFKPSTFFDTSACDEISKLTAICSLEENEKISINDEIFSYIFTANENLQKVWASHGNLVRKFLRAQISIATRNYHEISGWPLKKSKIRAEENQMAYQKKTIAYGTGSYAFTSLLNHSCAPNVHKFFIDGKFVIIAQRKIEAGDQIFDNYGFSFTNMEKKNRQFILLQQYCFSCDCEACLKNYSNLPSLKIIDKICLCNAKKISQELSGLNQKRAKYRIKEIADGIKKYHGNFPSLEVCSLIESFQACLEIYLMPEILFE